MDLYIKTRKHNSCVRTICAICGKSFRPNLVSAEVFVNDPDDNIFYGYHKEDLFGARCGELCKGCLDRGPVNAREVLLARAESLRQFADDFLSVKEWCSIDQIDALEIEVEKEIFGEE